MENVDRGIKQPGLSSTRRQAMGTLSSLGVLALFGCNGGASTTTSNTGTIAGNDSTSGDTGGSGSSNSGGTAGSCALIPQETEGPYPLLAILSNSAMVRKDITEGKTGIPLTLKLQLQNVNNACAAISNAAVYIWHCDKDGVYSGYSQPGSDTTGQTFLRGIQLSDSNGEVSFTTIYPGWYAGRITHIHFQIYLNDNLKVTATATSQIAFPPEITTAIYNSALYAAHGQNSSVSSFAADNVFSDGTAYQLANLSSDINGGYKATLPVGIAM